MNRRAWLLLIKIRAGKIHIVVPVLFSMLLYLLEMVGELKPYTFGRTSSKFYQIVGSSSLAVKLLRELQTEGPFDFVDIEAEDKTSGKVFVKVALW